MNDGEVKALTYHFIRHKSRTPINLTQIAPMM